MGSPQWGEADHKYTWGSLKWVIFNQYLAVCISHRDIVTTEG